MKLTPYSKADAEDWGKLIVTISCNGFTGEFVAWLQSQDIFRFKAELTSMYQSVGTPSAARLCSAEPDIDVELRMDAVGTLSALTALKANAEMEHRRSFQVSSRWTKLSFQT